MLVDTAIKAHIMACDCMYEGAYGKPDETPETSTCKRLIEMGIELTAKNLPDVCIRQCERWNLKSFG
jgi:hypothetical protein